MQYLMNTPGRLPISLVKGKGCKVWDANGKEYLDMVAGIAVCNLGHCHPQVVRALKKQSEELFHCSNLYRIPIQEMLAEELIKNSFPGKAFFCNSGAEANEGAIKLIRRFQSEKGERGSKIITCTGSFHGRTITTVAATGQEKFRKGFEPITEGFVHVEFGSVKAVEDTIDNTIGGILVEPIQGESGIRVPPEGYLKGLKELCTKNGILLALDEVQTGFARTGKMFAYMHEDITPDIMTLAKAFANGFPAGAIIAKPEVAEVFTPGTHASTFGGNPLAMAAAMATLNVMTNQDIPKKSHKMGKYLTAKLQNLKDVHPSILEIRGKGLMIGVEFNTDISFLTLAGIEKGILFNVINERIIRLAPPLVISASEIDRAVSLLDGILREKGL
jgi:predicted acetylornithine/succinylornithine family transaminase